MKKIMLIVLSLLLVVSAFAMAQGQIIKQPDGSYVMHISAMQLLINPSENEEIDYSNGKVYVGGETDFDLPLHLPTGAVINKISIEARGYDDYYSLDSARLQIGFQWQSKNDASVYREITDNQYNGTSDFSTSYEQTYACRSIGYKVTASRNLHRIHILEINGSGFIFSTVRIHFSYRGKENITGF